MNITERINQFAGDLSQRKLLVENRIAILKTTHDDNAGRVEQLEAVKKNIEEMQEVFFDFFYHELSGLSEPQTISAGRVGEQRNVINLDETLQQEESDSESKAEDLTPPVIQQTDQVAAATGKKVPGDLDALLNNIKNIQDKHKA